MKNLFHKLAASTSKVVGSPYAFMAAVALLVGWLASGPAFRFSDTWQLIINTTTTIVTFLMVFLIQNTQNRDSLALHLKLDELIRATKGARNSMIDLAKLTDQQLMELEREFERICMQGPEPELEPEPVSERESGPRTAAPGSDGGRACARPLQRTNAPSG